LAPGIVVAESAEAGQGNGDQWRSIAVAAAWKLNGDDFLRADLNTTEL
jgi:hypothetical protein